MTLLQLRRCVPVSASEEENSARIVAAHALGRVEEMNVTLLVLLATDTNNDVGILRQVQPNA
jgi:hypothetical protein